MTRSFRVLGALAFSAAAVATACRIDSRDDYLGDKDPRTFGLGRPVVAAKLASIDIDVSPSGAGLPPGSGTPEQGAKIFTATCAVCHGANGEGKAPVPPLVSPSRPAFDFATDFKIPRTIGNYWPYATTVFDYIRRAMPLSAPGSLTADQTYAVTAFLLQQEHVLQPGTVLDAKSLPLVKMPARDKFVYDDRAGNRGGKDVR